MPALAPFSSCWRTSCSARSLYIGNDPDTPADGERAAYRVYARCQRGREEAIRALLLANLAGPNVLLQEIRRQSGPDPDAVELMAEVLLPVRGESMLSSALQTFGQEDGVRSVRWEPVALPHRSNIPQH
jgi:hypothetical protein